jgi:hypothetical protein
MLAPGKWYLWDLLYPTLQVSKCCHQDCHTHWLTALRKCSAFSLNSHLYTGITLSLISWLKEQEHKRWARTAPHQEERWFLLFSQSKSQLYRSSLKKQTTILIIMKDFLSCYFLIDLGYFHFFSAMSDTWNGNWMTAIVAQIIFLCIVCYKLTNLKLRKV